MTSVPQGALDGNQRSGSQHDPEFPPIVPVSR
jgi:hypothetical protein